jgi:hypothetical protein
MQQEHRATKSERLYAPLTGAENVSESIEISAGTWEVHTTLQGEQYGSREVERRSMDGGVSHSSEEASNDRGAKGRQRVTANKRD